jgi:plastocyanin
MTPTGRLIGHTAAAVLLGLAMACGGGGGGGTPTNPSPPSGGPGPSGATITISNSVATPSSVTISVGQSVTFVNNDTRAWEIFSNPHPTHTNCPAINAVGAIQAGQTELTNAFTTAGTCGFHEHSSNDSIAGLRGTIIIR